MLKSLAVQAKLLFSKSRQHEEHQVQYYQSYYYGASSEYRLLGLRRDISSAARSRDLPPPSAVFTSKQMNESDTDISKRVAEYHDGHASSSDSHLGQDGLLRSNLIWILASASRRFMGLNDTSVHGAKNLEAALHRPSGQALITVSNHVAALDDPLVMSLIIPQSYYGQPESIRWTLCATDRCFKYKALSHLFTAAKVLPVERGQGLNQPGMMAAKQRLASGDWVHIFPEGTRSKDGKSLGSIRKGVGSLVASAAAATGSISSTGSSSAPHLPPLVIPFFHTGMNEVMPRGQILPSVGRKVSVIVGEPIEMDDLYHLAKLKGWSADRLHTSIASRISSHLVMLKRKLEAIESGSLDLSAGDSEMLRPGSVSDRSDIYDLSDLRRQSQGWQGASMWLSLKGGSVLPKPPPSAEVAGPSFFPSFSMSPSVALTRFFNSYAQTRELQVAQFLSSASYT